MKGNLVAGVASGVAAGALWGLVFLAPQALRHFDALQLSAARYLAYGVVAAALLLPRWRGVMARLGRSEWLGLLGLSLLGNILYYVLLATAVQWAGGASTSLIIGLLPVTVTLAGAREVGAIRLSSLVMPLALCLAGVGLVGMHALSAHAGADEVLARAAGLLCAFGALASWSAYSVGNSRWLARRPDISPHDWSLLTGIATGGLAVLIAIPAFSRDLAGHGASDWMIFWGISAAVAVFASVIGNAFWNRASRLLPLTLTGQMIIFETLFALLYGFLWDRRWPEPVEILAIVCLVAGVLWCTLAHRRHHNAMQHV